MHGVAGGEDREHEQRPRVGLPVPCSTCARRGVGAHGRVVEEAGSPHAALTAASRPVSGSVRAHGEGLGAVAEPRPPGGPAPARRG